MASDTQDLTSHTSVTALAATTAQTPSGFGLLLMDAGWAQEHIFSGVLMAPSWAGGPDQTKGNVGQVETQSPLLLGLETAAPRPVLSQHHPCHFQTRSKPLLPTPWPDAVR